MGSDGISDRSQNETRERQNRGDTPELFAGLGDIVSVGLIGCSDQLAHLQDVDPFVNDSPRQARATCGDGAFDKLKSLRVRDTDKPEVHPMRIIPEMFEELHEWP